MLSHGALTTSWNPEWHGKCSLKNWSTATATCFPWSPQVSVGMFHNDSHHLHVFVHVSLLKQPPVCFRKQKDQAPSNTWKDTWYVAVFKPGRKRQRFLTKTMDNPMIGFLWRHEPGWDFFELRGWRIGYGLRICLMDGIFYRKWQVNICA